MPRVAIGSTAEATQPDALKAALAEFISMLIFVFAGEGSGMAFSKNPWNHLTLHTFLFKIKLEIYFYF